MTQKSITRSRSEAKRAIVEGRVTINGKVSKTPSVMVNDNDVVVLSIRDQYASRGGIKLKGALDFFNVSPSGHCCLDVGASTGGFTDCLLKHGAKYVFAVDSGAGQMSSSLIEDERVCLFEKYNARYIKKRDFDKDITFAVMDVSFISQTLILPSLFHVLKPGSILVTLVKPQFELSKSDLTKKGLVKTETLRKKALNRVKDSALVCGYTVLGEMVSPILGGDGNVEYFLLLKKEELHEENPSASQPDER